MLIFDIFAKIDKSSILGGCGIRFGGVLINEIWVFWVIQDVALYGTSGSCINQYIKLTILDEIVKIDGFVNFGQN